jgi:hypothetical protein
MKIVKKLLSELHSPAVNIRKHTEKQLTEYVRSLEMWGQLKPAVVDEEGMILAGNGLYEALSRMGAETCDCYVLSGLTEAQKKKVMLSDNRVYELGITDMDAFDQIIKELEGDIDVPGWDSDLLEMMNASIQEATDMVESYGTFEQPEIDAMNKKQREEHTPGPPQQPQQPSGGVYTAVSPSMSNSPAAPQAPASGPAAEANDTSARYIICPKCGEKICL